MTKIHIMETVLRDGQQSQIATRMTTKEMLPVLKTLDEAGALNNLSEELAKIVKSKLFTSMVYQISGYSSSVELAAASVSSAGKTFLAPEITENNICIYTYDDGKPIAVTFILGDDGTVSANGIIILNDDFQHDSVEEIEEAFADFQAEVTQIK